MDEYLRSTFSSTTAVSSAQEQFTDDCTVATAAAALLMSSSGVPEVDSTSLNSAGVVNGLPFSSHSDAMGDLNHFHSNLPPAHSANQQADLAAAAGFAAGVSSAASLFGAAQYAAYNDLRCYICNVEHYSVNDFISHMRLEHSVMPRITAPPPSMFASSMFGTLPPTAASVSSAFGAIPPAPKNSFSRAPLLVAPARAPTVYPDSTTSSSSANHAAMLSIQRGMPRPRRNQGRNEGPHQCSICHKRFQQLGHLTNHQRLHTGERPYECEVCSKRFAQSGHLLSHLRMHTQNRPYECKFCKKAFTQSGHLNNHERLHSGIKPYECKVCHKRFTQSGHLSNHARLHSGERPFECQVCSKTFTQSGHLNNHMRLHMDGKPHVCKYCKKRFTQPGHLALHMRVHTGERPYDCPVCHKSFNQSGHLMAHLRTHGSSDHINIGSLGNLPCGTCLLEGITDGTCPHTMVSPYNSAAKNSPYIVKLRRANKTEDEELSEEGGAETDANNATLMATEVKTDPGVDDSGASNVVLTVYGVEGNVIQVGNVSYQSEPPPMVAEPPLLMSNCEEVVTSSSYHHERDSAHGHYNGYGGNNANSADRSHDRYHEYDQMYEKKPEMMTSSYHNEHYGGAYPNSISIEVPSTAVKEEPVN